MTYKPYPTYQDYGALSESSNPWEDYPDGIVYVVDPAAIGRGDLCTGHARLLIVKALWATSDLYNLRCSNRYASIKD